jgi:hypothetical protein
VTTLISRTAGVFAALVLAALGTGYYLTVEPAPLVNVTWRESVTAARRQQLENRLRLVRPEFLRGRTYQYDLLDTSRENVGTLVLDPEVENTGGVDRQRYAFSADYEYGGSWMWVAHRVPVLRTRGVVEGIAGVCVLVLGAAVVVSLRGRRPRPKSG